MAGGRPDAVGQARAWLVEHTGQAPGIDGSAGVPGPSPSTDGAGGSEGASRAAAAGSADAPVIPESSPSGSRRRAGSFASDEPAGPIDPNDPDADPEGVARTIALRKLAAQARTRHELDQALQKKNVPDDVAATVLDRLEEVGLVDDETFAQDWVASRQQRRHLSRSALRRELQGKGVDRDLVDSALATIDTDDELVAARALAVKKSSALRGVEPMVRRRRLAGALGRRGFGPGIISTVLSELGSDDGDDPGA